MSKPKQLSLIDIYSDCSDLLENDKPLFLSLLEDHISLEDYIQPSFYNHFYLATGRKRTYHLTSFLWALLLQRIFTIPTDTLLITFLKFSKELRDFCGFTKVPDTSKFTRFKQDFLLDLQSFFDSLVDVTEPICQFIDTNLASMTIFDTSGIEAYVTENNPKYANKLIRQLKSYKKTMKYDDSYDPYRAAYASMPSHAATNTEIKQLYINGHFCYVYKCGVITNGLGIIRHIALYNKAFSNSHNESFTDKKSTSPDNDKSIGDNTALIPTLTDFFKAHPLITPKTFLGDSAFDAVETYRSLFQDFHFDKAYIPLNKRGGLVGNDITYDELGRPLCPKDGSLPLVCEGNTKIKGGTPALKWVCPKTKWIGHSRRCFCDNPCTSSKSGRMTYTYPERDYRLYPGVARGDEKWNKTYKIRSVVEQCINHFKENLCVANRKTQNITTTHADLLLAGITQLFTVILADKIHKHEYLRSLKPLIA